MKPGETTECSKTKKLQKELESRKMDVEGLWNYIEETVQAKTKKSLGKPNQK